MATGAQGAQDKSASTARPASIPAKLRIPMGFKAKAGTREESYAKTGLPEEIVHEQTGVELVFIPAGAFDVGSPADEKGRFDNEGPVHRVEIARPFYMGKCEVTQGQWRKVMETNPSEFGPDDRLPVETVSWDECRGFLSAAGGGLRLPTEAEWEYACRAGTKTRFSFGDAEADLHEYANYCDRSNTNGRPIQDIEYDDRHDKTAPVGSFKPNGWGLYDMHGNVLEWCEDRYGEDYEAAATNNASTKTPAFGWPHVIRGGCYLNDSRYCRSACRQHYLHGFRYRYLGFRVVVGVVD